MERRVSVRIGSGSRFTNTEIVVAVVVVLITSKEFKDHNLEMILSRILSRVGRPDLMCWKDENTIS